MKHRGIPCHLSSLFILFSLLGSVANAQMVRGSYCSGDSIIDSYSYSIDANNSVTFHVRAAVYNTSGVDSLYAHEIGSYVTLYYNIHSAYDFSENQDVCDQYVWHVGNRTHTYTESGAYVDTIHTINGCDSIRRLNLVVRKSTTATQTETACDSFIWTTTQPDTNGIYDHGTYTASNNTDQIVLTNAVGCDSTITLNLTVNYNTNILSTDSVCRTGFTGDYNWVRSGSENYSYSGNPINQPTDGSLHEYTYSYLNSANCPSVDTLRLAIFKNDSLQCGQIKSCNSTVWRGNTYTATNDYEDIVSLAVNNICDSVYLIHIDIYSDSIAPMETDTISGVAFYTWRGSTYNLTLGYNYFYDTAQLAVHGICDSLFSIAINCFAGHTYDTMFCDSYSFTRRNDGSTFIITNDTVINDTLSRTVSGAMVDSVFIWNIRIRPSYKPGPGSTYPAIFIDNHFCDSTRWYNVTYWEQYNSDPAENHINDSLYTADGMTSAWLYTRASGGLCDSIIFMNLYMHPSHTDTALAVVEDSGAVCRSLTWHDSVYTASTTTYFMDTTAYGCDSLLAMKVIVHPDAVINEYVEGCGQYIYQFNAREYTHDTIDTVYVWPGVVQETGCDSVKLLHVTIYPTYDTTYNITACSQYTWVNNVTPHYDANHNPINDSLYRASTVLGPFTYNTHPQVSEHCDSTVRINLTIIHNDTVRESIASCIMHRFGDSIYRASTVIYDTLPGMAANGCQIIGEHTLTIHDSTSRYDTIHACYRYIWNTHVHTVTTDTVGRFANTNGCDSNIYLHLVIHDSTDVTTTDQVCGSTTWNGHYMPETIGSDVVYNAVAYHLTDIYGCDSTSRITMTIHPNGYSDSLATACDSYVWYGVSYAASDTASHSSPNIAANGCDSITTLYLTINYSASTVIDTTVCDSFDWIINGSNCGHFTTNNNTASLHLNTVDGCDSLLMLDLKVNNKTTGSVVMRGCDSVPWHGHWYKQTGTYLDTMTGANIYGCDSIVTLYLTIDTATSYTQHVSNCDLYTWPLNHRTYTHSTSLPTVIITNVAGCDSVVHLDLTIYERDRNAIDTRTACESFEWHGVTYRNSTFLPTFDTLTVHGCDSTVNLHLTVLHGTSRTVDTAVCDSSLWHTGVWYLTTTSFDDTLTAANGCDSVNHVNLTIVNPSIHYINVTACDSYTWNQRGETYTLTGEYHDTTVAASGCDSIIVLNLTINHSDTLPNLYNTQNYTACDFYDWNASRYFQSGTYHYNTVNRYGCDSISWLNLTINQTGIDTNWQVGCNSFVWGNEVYTSDTTFLYERIITSTCNIDHWISIKIEHPSTYVERVNSCESYEWTDNTNFRYTFYEDTVASIVLPSLQSGCDSTVTLRLSVNHKSTGYDSVSYCDSYYSTLLGRTFTESLDTLINLTDFIGITNQYGCDTLLHQVINIRHTSSQRVDTVVCHGISWNGRWYSSNTYGPVQARLNAEGCIHTDTLNLTVHTPDTAAIETLTACDSIHWHGQTYNLTGNYIQIIDSAANGVCDSVYRLNLTVYTTQRDTLYADGCSVYNWAAGGISPTISGIFNYSSTGVANGGCDSIHYLALTIHQDTTVFDTMVSCNNLTWAGNTYYNNTNDMHRFVGAYYGCDSVVWNTIIIHHDDTNTTHIHTTACGHLVWKGYDYRTSGVYRFDTLTVNGCDSTAWLHLTVNSYDTIDTVVVHDNNTDNCDSYTWTINGHSHTYTASGTYFDTVFSNAICGQLTRLDLTLLQSTSDTLAITQCGSWRYNGILYNGDTLIERGRDIGGNIMGCDSIHYMQIHIVRPVVVNDPYNVCDSLVWIDGNTYYESNNTATYEVPGGSVINGCDSTLNLQLTVRHSTIKVDTITGCDQRYWSLVGHTYYNDLDTLVNVTELRNVTNSVQCDSLIQMHINVPNSDNTIDSIKACGPVRWSNGVRYTASIDGPTYLDRNIHGCDSTVTLHLEIYQHVTTYEIDTVCDSTSWHNRSYNTSGVYVDVRSNVIGGACDSTYYYNLTVYNTLYAPVEHVVAKNYYLWPRTLRHYTQSNTYTQQEPLAVAEHCDSIYTLHLEIYSDSVKDTTVTACNFYMWRGRLFNATGHYSDTARNAVHGVADSIYNLELVLFYNDTVVTTVAACNEYTWYDHPYTISGSYYHYDRLAVGNVCDRVHRLNLTIQHTYSDSTAITACGSYDWRGSHYASSGLYSRVVARDAVNACDSIFKLQLTIHPAYRNEIYNPVACDEFYWAPANRFFTSDTSFVENLYTREGCDSIIHVNLHILYTSDRVSHRNMDVCESYTWPLTGVTYTASTVDTYTIHDGSVCDSTVTLHLTVHPVNTTVTVGNTCDTYTWRNRTFAETGSYSDTIRTNIGCDSILNLQLYVHQPVDEIFTASACDSYTWNGITYSESTNTPTYSGTTINGCDSTVTLHLTIYPSRTASDERTACDSFTWHGTTYTASTNAPTYSTTTTHGCDSTVTLHLTINYSSNAVLDTMVCERLNWIDGHTYTASTNTPTYRIVNGNAAGCDSTVTLHLTIGGTTSELTRTSCDSLLWKGHMYYESADVVNHYENVNSCDSVETCHVIVFHSASITESVTACDSYTWHGESYNYEPVDATYHTQTVAGCDSTVILALTLNRSTTSIETAEACDSYTWHGTTYTESQIPGDATYVTTNTAGCDSTIMLVLDIRHSAQTVISETAVGYYSWNGEDYTTSGDYTQTFSAANGCDSVVTLHLAIVNFPMPQIVVHNDRLLMVNHYPNGEGTAQINYIAYRWYRNNTLIPNATNDYYSNANYQVLVGCFYVEVPIDNTLQVWVPSNELCLGMQGIDDADALIFNTYPNPVVSGSTLTVQTSAVGSTMTLYDQQGRQVWRHVVEQEQTVMPIDVAAGVYTLHLTTIDGKAIAKKLIVR